MFSARLDSPIGEIALVGDEQSLHGIGFRPGMTEHPSKETDLFHETIRQIHSYFEGSLRTFDLPLTIRGTDFQQATLRELLKVPFGSMVTYGDIAERLGRPKASRAVGAACGFNPLPLLIPCHRIIGKSGSLTGFTAGISIKEKLLQHEQQHAFSLST